MQPTPVFKMTAVNLEPATHESYSTLIETLRSTTAKADDGAPEVILRLPVYCACVSDYFGVFVKT